MSTRTSRQALRERALPGHAFSSVDDLVRDGRVSHRVEERYAALARRLPALLQSAGLGQTVAFLVSKSSPDSAEVHLLNHLGLWLLRKQTPKSVSGRDLMRAILNAEPGAYRRMTREASTLADWLKRFATGLVGEIDE